MKNFFLFSCIFLISCSQRDKSRPHVLIDTGFGDIEVELYPTKAPKTVNAFLSYIDAGYYKSSSFYRVIKSEDMPTDFNDGLIQGGVWPHINTMAGIEHESTTQTGLSHTNGTISLARKETGTATTEFFICIGNQTQLDAGRKGTGDGFGYAAFGKVIKGMDAVRKIQAQKSDGENFREKITINKIKRLSPGK